MSRIGGGIFDGRDMSESHQHHFEGRAVFAGCGVRAVGTNESNIYRRTQRKKRFFGVAINTHEHRNTIEHNI